MKNREIWHSIIRKRSILWFSTWGLQTGVSPLTMAGAYSAFANEGYKTETHLITKIVDSTGAIVVDNTKVKKEQVITKDVADGITSMLLGVFSSGSGSTHNQQAT